MASPAASALVQVSGRRLLPSSEKMAPEPASQRSSPAFQKAR